MKNVKPTTRAILALSVSILAVTTAAATTFDVPGGSLEAALDTYSAQSGLQLVIPNDEIRGIHSSGVRGDLDASQALSKILAGTGYMVQRSSAGLVGIVKDRRSEIAIPNIQMAQAKAPVMALETVTVTSSKLGGADVQSIPIAITALSQEQLTATQTSGGPDLVKQVPNLTFTKTNFTGYSINIRGIGTQAISVTTDPAVAVALNDIPFIRNHFFEQEFYDVGQLEVLRGPQGTLYGRNSTAGVVNVISAKPTDQFEAMASADIGNYKNRRFEGMVNLPITDDRLDLRIAGEWTKRDGYSFNETTSSPIDGRDLWSARMTLGWKPEPDLQVYLIWEHFSEDDDRIRSAKQLCKTDYGPGGTPTNGTVNIGGNITPTSSGSAFIQGCVPASLYSAESFQTPNGPSLPYVEGLIAEGNANGVNPYGSTVQSTDLRVVNSGLNPTYKAKNDVAELNAEYSLTPALSLTSQTGFGNDFLFSAEDYNRFGAAPGLFSYSGDGIHPQFNGILPDPSGYQVCTISGGGYCGGLPKGSQCPTGVATPGCSIAGYVCDPQVGCSDKLILEDLSDERSWQLSQEFRLASNFSGPLNFSAGGNFLHYETVEDYYVFGNVLTLISGGFVPGNNDANSGGAGLPQGYQYNNPTDTPVLRGAYIDPNPISNLDGNGHNYFRSENPYVLNSYALFGETYYNITNDLKLVGGLRWTDDRKHFSDVPSWLVEDGWGYPVAGVVNQSWSEFTGRAVANWTPKLSFTDQTLVYGSYSHGYKAGGANPPGAILPSATGAADVQPTHPLTFKPEFIDAYELGTKNTLLDGALTLNGDIFFYNYKSYQISEIVDRTAINLNYDAKVKGAELETSWEPLPGLKFNFTGGYEDTRIDDGQSAIDLIDRTASVPGWVVVKPFVNEATNCIFPANIAAYMSNIGAPSIGGNVTSYCAIAYILHDDPLTGLPYVQNPTTTANNAFGFGGNPPPAGYPGFDPATAPNDGTGFGKNLGGNQLPNAPHFTTSLSADYTVPVTSDWAATLHGDFYWQSQSWWRVFNDKSYDQLRGYTNVNLALILSDTGGWQAMGYVKNVFNVTAITGAFLNSDDSGLPTNVFLTDPRLFGVRVTKNW